MLVTASDLRFPVCFPVNNLPIKAGYWDNQTTAK